MTLNRTAFFGSVRGHFGRLSQPQVDGFAAILNEWERRKLTDLRHLAYMLATAWHETARTMQPIRERGSGDGPDADKWDDYLERYDTGRLAKALGNTPAADGDGVRYAGAGLVQITGRANFERAGRKLGIDLLGKPELARDLNIAVQIMFDGMEGGWFTGRRLSQFFNASVDDPEGARRIINGTDRAALIAGHHRAFLKALRAAETAAPLPPPPDIEPVPAPAPRPASAGFFVSIIAALSRLFRRA